VFKHKYWSFLIYENFIFSNSKLLMKLFKITRCSRHVSWEGWNGRHCRYL